MLVYNAACLRIQDGNRFLVKNMNRREFVGYATLAPLVATDLEGVRAAKPSILLPDSARVYDIGRGEARILVGAEQSGGA